MGFTAEYGAGRAVTVRWDIPASNPSNPSWRVWLEQRNPITHQPAAIDDYTLTTPSLTFTAGPNAAMYIVRLGTGQRCLVPVPGDEHTPELEVTIFWPSEDGSVATLEGDRIVTYDINHEKDPFGIGFPEASSATITFDNYDGRYSPENEESPLHGLITVGALIWVRWVGGGVVQPIFTGYLDQFSRRGTGTSGILEARCIGVTPVSGETLISAQSDLNIAGALDTMLDALDFPDAHRIFNGDGPAIFEFAENGANAIVVLRNLAAALQKVDVLGNVNGFIGETKSGYMRMDESGYYSHGVELPLDALAEVIEISPEGKVINIVRGEVFVTRELEGAKIAGTQPTTVVAYYSGREFINTDSDQLLSVAVRIDGRTYRIPVAVIPSEGTAPPSSGIPLRFNWTASTLPNHYSSTNDTPDKWLRNTNMQRVGQSTVRVYLQSNIGLMDPVKIIRSVLMRGYRVQD